MCEFCETNDANRLFRGLKVAKWVVECWVSAVFQAVATGENGDIGWRSGESVVQSAEMVVNYGVCVVGCGGW